MEQSTIWSLPEQEALDEIVDTVLRADIGEAPFALVLGSGFSRGLVPTARELVSESLPLWLKCRDEGKQFEDQVQDASERGEIARSFWKRFSERNSAGGLNLKLDSVTGLPEDNGEAYRAAFSPRHRGAVGAPADARRFQRAMMRLNKPRLNAAHFLLASLLGVQPGKNRESSLFRSRAAFSRLILTTNFDPFLQTALQAVNRLYFMSDTPELGLGDDIFDDQTDAIHLVYLHGSIHRRSQAATDQDIQRLKEKNARTLAPVLKRRGVIVLGYSGWDDAIVAALAECEEFDYRLYWCGLEADPLTKGAFGPGVEAILHKPSAFYVQSAGAGNFMAQLCRGLVKGNPRLLDNPIGQLRDLLNSIDLKELEELKPLTSKDPGSPQPIQSGNAATTLVEAKRLTIERLKQAEQVFLKRIPGPAAAEISEHTDARPTRRGDLGSTAMTPIESNFNIQQFLSSAQLALGLANYEECLRLCNEALAQAGLETSDKAELMQLRALAYYYSGDLVRAMGDWTFLVDLQGAPVEQVAQALYNRGVTWGQEGNTENEIADYTRVIELPGAPVEQVAEALYNRGAARGQQGDTEREIADYSQVMDLPDVSIEQVAHALVNRGVAFGKRGDTQKEMGDYTRVIEQLPGAPVEQVAQALYNRGVTWGEQGETKNELDDYTRVIGLPGAPVEQVAEALYNRGLTWGEQGETKKEIEDYTRVSELPGAPVEQVAESLYNRGIAWGHEGAWEKEIADYSRVIELPGISVEQVAQALVNRGIAWGQQGDLEKKIADYTRLIDLPGVSVEQLAETLYNRGVAFGQKGETEKEIADYTRVIELPEAPVEQVAQALYNRGLAFGMKGETEREIEDYTRVIELPGASVAQVTEAIYNRGIAYGQLGDAEKEIAEFTRVIEFPGAPVEQVAQALYNRGVAWGQAGDAEKEIAEYTRVIELPGAPVEQVAEALYNRGVAWGQLGDSEKEIIDYTRAIELPGAPVEQVAEALYNRGVVFGQRGMNEKEMADYSCIIELPGAPMEQVAQALSGQGWVHYLNHDLEGFLAATEAAVKRNPELDFPNFNLGLALLAVGRDADALAAYRAAAERFNDAIESLGLEDLREANQKWLTNERAQPVIQLLESLKK